MANSDEELSAYERGFIGGYMAAAGILKPTEKQFREALLALVAFQSPTSTAHH